MDLYGLKERLQEHFRDGLVTVVGSGLSAAEGLPGMPALARHLLERVPTQIPAEAEAAWATIACELERGTDLESALLRHAPTPAIEEAIVKETSDLVLDAEAVVLRAVLAGVRALPLTRLLGHILKPREGIPIITTNYDRLVEVAVEEANLSVDSLFAPGLVGRHDPRASRFSLCRDVHVRKPRAALVYAAHVRVMKPHGSLDWFVRNGEPVRCQAPWGGQPLMITPGQNKYRGGYDRPFDEHRQAANRAIDRCSRLLTLGYGFNDEHLQTHLTQQIRAGKPTLILARTLSAIAATIVQEGPQAIALSAMPDDGGTLVTDASGTSELPGLALWNLDTFVSEVLEP